MFKIGDKVVCIDDSIGKITKNKILIKDRIYTILDINYKSKGVKLEEVESLLFNNKKYSLFFDENRFRKIEEQDFGSLILENIKEQIKEEELIEV